MLINSMCIDKELNVYIASNDDICNLCLDEFTIKNKVTYVQAREQLKGKLNGERIFKLRFHGGTYILCEHHLRKILDMINPEEAVVEEVKEEKPKEEVKHTTRRKKADGSTKDLA